MPGTRTLARPLDRAALRERIAAIPSVHLAHLPTPLEHCPRLAARLGGPDLWVKRDDLTGLAFGGNKTRQLEYLFADIVASGADVVVAGAYTQSNWCRQITAATRKLDLDAALVLVHGEKGPERQGNLLLDELMGADVTVVDIDDIQRLPPLLREKAAELAAAGRRPYLVSPFELGVLARSSVGYVAAAVELDEQLERAGVHADHIYVAGANMTPAGLLLGMRALGRDTRVVGISPVRWDEPREVDIARIANATAELLGIETRLVADDVTSYEDYVGPRYGVVTPESREAMRLAASTEGLILDPVYTSKALAGLIDHVRRGQVGAGETVVFMHTGGTPAVFSYAPELLARSAPL
ncbi:MAG: D-cysteine desulfhydrase family protein [Ectothiorhodospiraceae bacterium]|nr:D-cysteine desulfhydrase family protein [Ectothiorhodospiraceae bacterium]